VNAVYETADTWADIMLNKRAIFGAKNIHAFLRKCGILVGAFYFDAPCSVGGYSIVATSSESK